MASPQPIVRTLRAFEQMNSGQVLKVTTDEARSISNFEAMRSQPGHNLLEIINLGRGIHPFTEKGIEMYGCCPKTGNI